MYWGYFLSILMMIIPTGFTQPEDQQFIKNTDETDGSRYTNEFQVLDINEGNDSQVNGRCKNFADWSISWTD